MRWIAPSRNRDKTERRHLQRRVQRDGQAALKTIRNEWRNVDSPARARPLIDAHQRVYNLLLMPKVEDAWTRSRTPVPDPDALLRFEDMLRQWTELPVPLYTTLGHLHASALELKAAHEALTHVMSPASDCPDHGIHVEVPTSILYQLRRILLPAERMAVGATRRTGQKYQVETVFDVTERCPTPTHVNADPDKLTNALLDMDASGAFFGFWAHSQPGNSLAATLPSQEDHDNYAARLRSGDSQNLLGLIIAGDFLRFFGPHIDVQLVGEGVRQLDDQGGGYVYAFEN
jgi:hypothetical protein